MVRLKQTLAAEREQREYRQNKVKEYSGFLNEVGQGHLSMRLAIDEASQITNGNADELAHHINEATASTEQGSSRQRE